MASDRRAIQVMATRRPLEETRDRILAAGLELLTEQGFAIEASNIGLIDACRQAGLSTAGSGYKIWSSQDDFHIDLWRYAVTRRDALQARIDEFARGPELAGEFPDRRELIRRYSGANLKEVSDLATMIRQRALFLAAARDEEVRKGYVEAQRELVTALSEDYLALMGRYDTEMRPPFTVEQLAVAVEAEVRGMSSLCAFSDDFDVADIRRSTGEGGAEQSWHLLGCAIEAIVEAFTRPRSPDPSV